MVARSLVVCAVLALARAAPEWKEAFRLADTSHTWIMQKKGGAYADPTMWLVLIPTANPTKNEVAKLEPAADALAKGACATMNPGSTMVPAAAGSCFTLAVDNSKDDSTWTIDTTGLAGVLMYAQHVPTEFERDRHYFQNSLGGDIEPVPYAKRWGAAIGASLIVNVITLVGVVLMVPVVSTLYRNNQVTFGTAANAFAAGALIAAAFYLMLFEGSHYVAVAGRPESETAFNWGTMVLVGIITASVMDLLVTSVLPAVAAAEAAEAAAPRPAEAGSTTAKAEVEAVQVHVEPTAEPDAEGAPASKTKVARVRCGVLVGDFMHNLCDGIFIGTAFTGCSDALAWNIAVATVAHELAQEIADYVVLTDPKQGNLSPKRALALNFLSGTSVVLGAVIALSAEMDNRAIGMVLTFGGGIYVQIGLGEAMARVYSMATSIKLKALAIAFFCLGALAIGLVLLDHQHCDTGGGHAHAH